MNNYYEQISRHQGSLILSQLLSERNVPYILPTQSKMVSGCGDICPCSTWLGHPVGKLVLAASREVSWGHCARRFVLLHVAAWASSQHGCWGLTGRKREMPVFLKHGFTPG